MNSTPQKLNKLYFITIIMKSITVDLAHILNQLDLFAAVIDEDFNIIMINDKVKELFGDVVGKKCYRVFHSTDSPPEYCAIMNLLRGWKGEEEFYESSIGKWLRVRVSKLNIDGSTMFLHFAEDFTERKKFEEELKERELGFRTLAENSIAGVFIYQDDYFVYCNSACEKFTRFTKDELLKMHFWEVVHPDLREIAKEKGKKIQRGEIVEPNVYEIPYCTKNGEVRWGIFSFSNTIFNGKAAGFGIFFDITEKKKIEEKLRRNEERYRDLWENANDIFYVHNLNGHFIDANKIAFETFGYTKEELGKRNIADIVDESYVQLAFEKIKEILRTKKPTDPFELLCRTKNGEPIWVEIRARPIIEDGEVVAIQGIARDVTQRKKMEEELKRRERKYRMLFENSMDVIVVSNLKGELVEVNKAFENLSKYSRDEVIGQSFKKVVADEYADLIFQKYYEGYKRKKDIRGVEFEVVTKKGDRIFVEGNISLTWEGDKIVGFQGNFRDITDRKRIEEKLKESESLYRTLVEKTHDAVYLIDRNGFLFVNDNVCKITGYSKEELYKIDPLSLIHPEDRDRIRDYLTRRFMGEDAPESHISKVITKHGDIRYCEFSVKSIMYKGKRVVLGSVRDITEKKLMEDKLRESEKRYRTLVETINDIVFVLDVNGKFTYLNRKFEEITGYSIKDMLGKHFAEIVAPEYIESTINRFKRGLAGEVIPVYEIEIVKSDGERIPVELNVTNLHDDEGNVVGRLGVARDITKRKKMERDLIELNDTLRLINKIMRHDILNDLTVIDAYLQLYRENRDEKALEKVFKAIERSVKLINQMRELEELTTTRELKPYSVKAVLDEVIKKYDIDFNIKGNCTVLADEVLPVVIDNIVRNAITHGKTDRIDVTINRLNDFCEIRIADYGKGIPNEIKDKLFDEGFYYGETGHTGLGLYIVKKVVERYGGDVSVEDNKPRGSVFVVRLKGYD